MAVDFSTMIYLPVLDLFGRDVVITPRQSNPSGVSFSARGVYMTDDVDVMTENGAMISDQKTILDVRDAEFIDAGQQIPQQGDLIHIPAEDEIPAEGPFEVTDVDRNGGGLSTLSLRKYIPSEP